MAEIIFALDPQMPQSYTDLLALIRLNGYPTVTFSEIDPASDNCYIMPIANGNNAAGWRHPKARIVLWDLEWRPESYPRIPGCEYWHMDKGTADRYGVKYVPVGGDARLGTAHIANWSPPPMRYDIAYYGYIQDVPRRKRILDQLQDPLRHLTITPSGLWDVEPNGIRTNNRDGALCVSRLYLHVHQREDSPGVPGLRMVVAAAYGLPVLSETFEDAGIFRRAVMDIDYAHVVDCAEVLLNDPNGAEVLDDLRQRLAYLLNEEYTFAKGIEAAV